MQVAVGEAVEVEIAGLRFAVARREVGGDGGLSIEIHGEVDGRSTALVRFDCFREAPHYHAPASAAPIALEPGEVGDGLEWALAQTRERLPELLRAAGFPELAGGLDAEALRRDWERLRDAAKAAPEPTRRFEVDPDTGRAREG